MVLVLTKFTILATSMEITAPFSSLALSTSGPILDGHGSTTTKAQVPTAVDTRSILVASLASAAVLEGLAFGCAPSPKGATSS